MAHCFWIRSNYFFQILWSKVKKKKKKWWNWFDFLFIFSCGEPHGSSTKKKNWLGSTKVLWNVCQEKCVNVVFELKGLLLLHVRPLSLISFRLYLRSVPIKIEREKKERQKLVYVTQGVVCCFQCSWPKSKNEQWTSLSQRERNGFRKKQHQQLKKNAVVLRKSPAASFFSFFFYFHLLVG